MNSDANASTFGTRSGTIEALMKSLPKELSPFSTSIVDSFLPDDASASFTVPKAVNARSLDARALAAPRAVSPLFAFKSELAGDAWDAVDPASYMAAFENSLFESKTPKGAGAGALFSDMGSLTPSTFATMQHSSEPKPFNVMAFMSGAGPFTEFVQQMQDRFSERENAPGALRPMHLASASFDQFASNVAPAQLAPDAPPDATAAPPAAHATSYNVGHPSACKACAFYWTKGCNNGANCQFCHGWHVPKRKKPMREQRNLVIIAKVDGKITFLRCNGRKKAAVASVSSAAVA